MKITVLPGDGIGVEVTREAVKVLKGVAEACALDIRFDQQLVGGAAIDAAGEPLPESSVHSCIGADAVLLGAVGAPKHDHLPPERRAEQGLLKLRKLLGGYANLRPAKAYPELVDTSPLRREIFEGTDLLIVRELLGGIYFGEPRGTSEDGQEAFNTMRYSVPEVERIARIAFDAARLRRKKVTSVDKANVLEASQLWRRTVEQVAKEYPDVALEHNLVDSCAMHLVTRPTHFDVILTENAFGDILSDEAAVLTGSIGMLPSATIGGKIGLYEPSHGSAPDIAGKNLANPLGAIGSAAMLLRYSAKNERAAGAVEKAIEQVLAEGYRTADIAAGGKTTGTAEMGDLVCRYAIANI